ncbi:MAG: glucosamine-6-phosphate deaminase [Proteobacteria bacterium]|nr:glucosamine-6-phosphate deaminase [Pseudomonadota bacterium]
MSSAFRTFADRLCEVIFERPLSEKKNPVLGLATGSTPKKMYEKLISMHTKGWISFRNCTTFNLDEYVGLPSDHSQSYHYYMRENLFGHIDIPKNGTHIPNGNASDLRLECLNYEDAIKTAGGIDLQILGIGSNGHIGFNEPIGSLSSRTWIKILTQNTIKDNARFFDDDSQVPRHVITMGIGTILEADHCLILACGKRKSQAVQAMIEGPITSQCPASALQFHKRTTAVLDEDAACLLKLKSHYKWVEENHLDWQRYE